MSQYPMKSSGTTNVPGWIVFFREPVEDGEDVGRAELLHRPQIRAVVQFVRRNPMVFSVARQEDDRERASLSHSRRIAWRAVRGYEELRLFVLEFKRIAERRASNDPDDGRRHGERTKSHRAIKLPSPRSSPEWEDSYLQRFLPPPASFARGASRLGDASQRSVL